MRKAQKDLMTNFLKLLEQAHEQIKEAIEQKHLEAVLELLRDCQEGALALGNLIEKSGGEGIMAISILEEYCKMLYQIHENIAKGGEVSASKVFKTLNQVSNNVLNDITVRREVVFLPYKASMWDSLESVWKEADADPECDVYVIPIPYYDKNPDGSFREIHYEWNEFPKEVPIISYEKYDFSKRHPDEIYIHNPYDEYNLVTSVHPFFYSKNLKQYTDKLVYIPYFVLAEINPKDLAAVEGMAHFVTVPGVIYADKVIVQSENMRQVYIDIMARESGEETRQYWEAKISGAGSPKYEKVLNTQVRDEDIPEEWKKKIIKPDGSKKKVILYNTSVSALLQYSEQYITKMRSVFLTFKKYDDEVTLLWRPHPLMQATLLSMRPQLQKEYQNLINEYKNNGIGIYDDTSEFNRAVGMANAYYGDASSVVQLCQKIGMPVMMQNVGGS